MAPLFTLLIIILGICRSLVMLAWNRSPFTSIIILSVLISDLSTQKLSWSFQYYILLSKITSMVSHCKILRQINFASLIGCLVYLLEIFIRVFGRNFIIDHKTFYQLDNIALLIISIVHLDMHQFYFQEV